MPRQRLTRQWLQSLTQEDFDQIPEWREVGHPGAQWYEPDELRGGTDPSGKQWYFIRIDEKLYKMRRR